jgi:hypothetical protein
MPYKIIVLGSLSQKNATYFLNDLIFWVLQSQYVQKIVEDLVNEAAQPNIGKADLEIIKIPIPSLKEQKNISKFISSIDDSIKTVETKTLPNPISQKIPDARPSNRQSQSAGELMAADEFDKVELPAIEATSILGLGLM